MERSLVSLVDRTDPQRVAHVVCTMRQGGPLAEDLPPHVGLDTLDIRGTDRLAALRLAALLRRRRPDILHARNWNTWTDCVIARRLLGTNRPVLVLGYHGSETPEGVTARQQSWGRRLRLSSARFTTVSRAGRAELVRKLHVPTRRIRVLTNGVDTEWFRPPDARSRRAARDKFRVQPGDVAAAVIAALVPVKDHDTLLDALRCWVARPGRSHPSSRLRLLIAGQGPTRGALERRAARLPAGIAVSFLGRRSDVRDVLHASDLFISSSRYEQMSNALLEAMACGLPAVATDVGDSGLLIEHGRSGLLVPPGDSRALAGAVDRLVADADLRHRLGVHGRRRVLRRFDLGDAVERYLRFYESLIPRMERKAHTCAASLE